MHTKSICTYFLIFVLATSTDASKPFDPSDPRSLDPKMQYFNDLTSECLIPLTKLSVCDIFTPYRTYDGTCNNLAHPTWGMAEDVHLRFLRASYEGQSRFRKSVTGAPLPDAREITVGIFRDQKHPTPKASFMLTIWGQVLAHDISLGRVQEVKGDCCSPELVTNQKKCASVKVRRDDPFYSKYNVTCLPLVRNAPNSFCMNGKWQQTNVVTATLDLSLVYGNNKKRASELRTNDGTGCLKSEQTSKGSLLPRPGPNSDKLAFCSVEQRRHCFLSGDRRTNQHAPLMSAQTILMNEHNRIARELKIINPQWDDETLYQEARRINIAEYQNIVYSQYLPVLLGDKYMSYYKLYVRSRNDDASHRNFRSIGDRTLYDPYIRLGAWNEFSNAVFRLHSMVASKSGVPGKKFWELQKNFGLVREVGPGKILNGVCTVPSEQYDRWFAEDVSSRLLQGPDDPYGFDLMAIDVNRGRDHGLPGYVKMLKFLSHGKLRVEKFEDLSILMKPEHVNLLEAFYPHVDDIDLYVGIHLEYPVAPDTYVTPTSAAIIAEQFQNVKYGDRFYFEHKGQASSFTQAQLDALRQSSLARWLCDHTETETAPKNPMLLESAENPVVPCEQIPKVDLTFWKASSRS